MNQVETKYMVKIFKWMFVLYCGLSLYFIFVHWQILRDVTHSQAAGERELYPNQYSRLIVSSYKSMLTSLLLPVPFLMSYFGLQQRRRAMLTTAAIFVLLFLAFLFLPRRLAGF
jgi:hypothetical protein